MFLLQNIEITKKKFLFKKKLKEEKEAGRTFVGFKEGPINFAPTYKYDLYRNVYFSGEDTRNPAWTDRILWKNHGEDTITQLEYRRSEIPLSDHRPVWALFDVIVTKKVNGGRISLVVGTEHLKQHSSEASSSQTTSSKEVTPVSPPSTEKAKVLFDYTPENSTELALKTGEIIQILKKDSSGWWKASKQDQIGWVPESFVEIIKDTLPVKNRISNKLASEKSNSSPSSISPRKERNSTLSNPSIIKEGYMQKKGHIRKNWVKIFLKDEIFEISF